MRTLISLFRPPMGRDTCFPRAPPTSPPGAHHFPLSRADADVSLLPPLVCIFPWVHTNHIVPLDHSLDASPSVPTVLFFTGQNYSSRIGPSSRTSSFSPS